MREKYQEIIKKRIKSFPDTYVFTTSDFLDIGDIDPVNKALSRLCEDKLIRRIIKGVYDKPAYSSLIGEYSEPNIENVAAALSRKFNWTIAPTGETALNYLHLTTQISNKWCYISDGPYRQYEVGPYTIEFKHCANRETSGRSRITIVVIQAIKTIGKSNITKKNLDKLANILSEKDKKIIMEEARTSTAWVYKLIREVCKNETSGVIEQK